MKLETNRLFITPCTEDYLSSTEYKVGPHIHMYIENVKNDPTLFGWGPWFVYQKETKEIIGDIGFKGKPNEENAVEIGYGIIPSAQGKGYATEAVHVLVQYAFSQNVDCIIAECLDDNLASIKVLEKLGMRRVNKEGHMLKWQMRRD